jgi:hypothetical protein
MIPDDAFAAMVDEARVYRVRVAELGERAQVEAAVRGRVKRTNDPPEPPVQHKQLVAEIVQLLANARLSPWLTHELACAFFNRR